MWANHTNLNIFTKSETQVDSNKQSMYPTIFFNNDHFNQMWANDANLNNFYQIWDTGLDSNKQSMYPTVFFNNMMISTINKAHI